MSDSSAVYDADAVAMELPAMRIGERVHIGRLLSIPEWFAFKDRLAAQAAAEKAEGDEKHPATMEAARQLMLEFLRAMFPPVLERRFLIVPRTIDPIAVIDAHGLRDVQTTFVRFFIHQRRAMGFIAPLPTMTEPSPNQEPRSTSSGSTAAASDGAVPRSASEPAS